MSIKKLTLIVPGILDKMAYLDPLAGDELPELAAFSCLLSRGQWSFFNQTDYYALLFDYFSVDPQNHRFPATGPIDYGFHFDQLGKSNNQSHHHFHSSAWFMRADPCFMAPDRDQLILAESDKLDLSYSEAVQLIKEINTFFHAYPEESFWQLEISPKKIYPLAWFINSSKPLKVHAEPTDYVKGHSVKDRLLKGEEQSQWRNRWNELQMVLHQSDINQKRRALGKLPVNSVWLWGAGKFDYMQHETLQPLEVAVFCDDTIVKGLSQLASCEIHDVPHRFDHDFMIKNSSEVLVVMHHLTASLQQKDAYGWLESMQRLEQDWLDPILQVLKSKQLQQLVIVTPSGRKLTVYPRYINRWWKKIHHYRYFICK